MTVLAVNRDAMALTLTIVSEFDAPAARVWVTPESRTTRSLTESLRKSCPVCTVWPPTWTFMWMWIARPWYQPG